LEDLIFPTTQPIKVEIIIRKDKIIISRNSVSRELRIIDSNIMVIGIDMGIPKIKPIDNPILHPLDSELMFFLSIQEVINPIKDPINVITGIKINDPITQRPPRRSPGSSEGINKIYAVIITNITKAIPPPINPPFNQAFI
jgi:hypothetical protein